MLQRTERSGSQANRAIRARSKQIPVCKCPEPTIARHIVAVVGYIARRTICPSSQGCSSSPHEKPQEQIRSRVQGSFSICLATPRRGGNCCNLPKCTVPARKSPVANFEIQRGQPKQSKPKAVPTQQPVE